MNRPLEITHFVRRTPNSNAWVQLTAILRDEAGEYHFGLEGYPLPFDIEEAESSGSLVPLPHPIELGYNRWLWLAPNGSVWYTSDTDPIGSTERFEVTLDEVVMEHIIE